MKSLLFSFTVAAVGLLSLPCHAVVDYYVACQYDNSDPTFIGPNPPNAPSVAAVFLGQDLEFARDMRIRMFSDCGKIENGPGRKISFQRRAENSSGILFAAFTKREIREYEYLVRAKELLLPANSGLAEGLFNKRMDAYIGQSGACGNR